MAFEPGHKLAKGRPSGSLNRRSQAFFQAVEEEQFDAAREMIDVCLTAKSMYKNYALIYEALEQARIEKGEISFPTEDRAHEYLKIALTAAKDIASYCYPKPRFPDQKNNQYLEGMTPEQKLDALKQAQNVLELEIKAKNAASGL